MCNGNLRMLEFVVLQFFVIVILPNNTVGTPQFPAVGVKSVLSSAVGCSSAPFKGESTAFVQFGLESTESGGEDCLVLLRHEVISVADILHVSRRLRI